MKPEDIPQDLIDVCAKNGKLKELMSVYLHSFTDEEAFQSKYHECLERMVVYLGQEVHDLIEVIQLHGILERASDVIMIKDALVNEKNDVRRGIGAALRFYRLKKGFTLGDLAELRGNFKSVGQLSLIENGKMNFQIDTMLDICQRLGLRLSISAVPLVEEKAVA